MTSSVPGFKSFNDYQINYLQAIYIKESVHIPKVSYKTRLYIDQLTEIGSEAHRNPTLSPHSMVPKVLTQCLLQPHGMFL